ncbi:hypothetical protein KY363_02555 [Candidatus Woesearchaeota archaeon]|nr:hypothetical protein [Candidatus Woesearchaeota archaeon]
MPEKQAYRPSEESLFVQAKNRIFYPLGRPEIVKSEKKSSKVRLKMRQKQQVQG